MKPSTRLVIRLGITQIIGWGSGFYIPAILAVPISNELGISTESFFWAFTFSLLLSGLLGPRVGKAIDRYGGRKVLPIGTLSFAAGLVLLALSVNYPMLLIGWLLIGVGASMGNYDAAFATAVNFFAEKSNKVIAGITVFAGFSSTVSWPLTSLILDQFGWREAVWFWVLAHLLISLPLHMTIPKSEMREVTDLTGPIRKLVRNKFRLDLLVVIFAVMFALEGFIVSAVNTTLPFLLSELGATSAVALLASTILGPSQVMARVLLVALDRYLTPMRTAFISIVAHPLGVVLVLIFGVDALIPFVILHGIGVGLNPFIRGSLPLLFFGADHFGQRQGYIMMLAKVISALSPTLLTLLVLSDPILGIWVTGTLGFTALLLLGALELIRRARL